MPCSPTSAAARAPRKARTADRVGFSKRPFSSAWLDLRVFLSSAEYAQRFYMLPGAPLTKQASSNENANLGGLQFAGFGCPKHKQLKSHTCSRLR